ncbi:MAG: hypothetical protein ABIQ16_05025, partial [Polyangiaceae bacterium]
MKHPPFGIPWRHASTVLAEATQRRLPVFTLLVKASMGPPREHGGMRSHEVDVFESAVASMGPPREHGG